MSLPGLSRAIHDRIEHPSAASAQSARVSGIVIPLALILYAALYLFGSR